MARQSARHHIPNPIPSLHHGFGGNLKLQKGMRKRGEKSHGCGRLRGEGGKIGLRKV